MSSWFESFSPNPAAKARLFCFSYAGGNPTTFRDWHRFLPSSLEILAIQLPGHGTRVWEKPFSELKPLIEELNHFITEYSEKPFLFFGHSLGALLAFELARQLGRSPVRQPSLLILSACSAPEWMSERSKKNRLHPGHLLSDELLIQKLKELGGTPKEVLENSELMKLFLPAIRADLCLSENYIYEAGIPLSCPMIVCGGEKDDEVDIASLDDWSLQTSSSFKKEIFPGNHFYLYESKIELLKKISEEIDLTLKF